MEILITKAAKSDLDWINSQYKEINFLLSDLKDEQIVLAKADGKNAGVGRLKKVNEHDAELGGIYVLPVYRKLGIARKIVSALVDRGVDYTRIFCLPYEHLKSFYESFGFGEVQCGDQIPEEVKKKMQFCGSTYETKTLLLVKKKDQT